MHAVRDGDPFALRSPKTAEVVRRSMRAPLGRSFSNCACRPASPISIFSDTVNRAMPKHQRDLGLKVRQSNLCSEIMLPTGEDHLGDERTAVCCLSSVNARDVGLEWRDIRTFIEDVMRFLDNVLQDFIDRAPPEHGAARLLPACASARSALA